MDRRTSEEDSLVPVQPRGPEVLDLRLSEERVTGTAEGFKVEPKRFLEDEVWRMVTDIVVSMGGQWFAAGKNGHWLIPRRAAP